jgi:hypothetical protein
MYRGKRLDNGEWVYGYLIGKDVIVGDIVELCEEYFNCEYWWRVDPETVGQSTEVTDKHRVELYKGDIFHLGDPKILYEVIWVAAGFVGKQIGSYNSYVGLSHWQERIEVIGNRFDHPHLLKGE